MVGNRLLLHLDDGGAPFVDGSGQGNDGACTACPATGAAALALRGRVSLRIVPPGADVRAPARNHVRALAQGEWPALRAAVNQVFRPAGGDLTKDSPLLFAAANALRDTSLPVQERVEPALFPAVQAIMVERPVRELITRGQPRQVYVDRPRRIAEVWPLVDEVTARHGVVTAIDHIVNGNPGGTVAVVCHAGVINDVMSDGANAFVDVNALVAVEGEPELLGTERCDRSDCRQSQGEYQTHIHRLCSYASL